MSGTRIASSLYLAMNLTERLVMSYRFKPLDVCIIRPSLILGAAKSPSPGFIGAPHPIRGFHAVLCCLRWHPSSLDSQASTATNLL